MKIRSYELNTMIRYVVNFNKNEIYRYKTIYKKNEEDDELLTDTFPFSFDVKLFESEIDNAKFTEVTLFKGNSVFSDFIDDTSKDGGIQLIRFLTSNYSVLDETKKYIKDEMKTLYFKMREEKHTQDKLNSLYVNGWNLKNKEYVKNQISLYDYNDTEKEEMEEVYKYFLETEESVVITLVDKMFNLIPYNTLPFVRNIYGIKDSGKTMSELISQSMFKFPEVLNTITDASLENIRTRTKNYILSFDESHLKGQNSELIYNLANDMVDQKMKRNGTGWSSSKRMNSYITATLVGETQYIPTYGGENDRIFYYEKKKTVFDNNKDSDLYDEMTASFYLLKADTYGIYFEEIIKFLEEKFEEIKTTHKKLKGSRREKTIQLYKYTFELTREFFRTKDVEVCDISSHIDSYLEDTTKSEEEMSIDTLIKLEGVLRKYNSSYIETKVRGSSPTTVGFIKRVKEVNTIYIYRNNKNIDEFCKYFNIEQTKLRSLFKETFSKKSSSIDLSGKTQSIFKFAESDIMRLKGELNHLKDSEFEEIELEIIKEELPIEEIPEPLTKEDFEQIEENLY